MSPRSLFNIILKVMGIYFIKELLALIPQFLSSFLFYTKSDVTTESFWILFSTIIIIAVYGLVIIYLILKTDWIIEKLQLDKGFEEETFTMRLHRSSVLSISVIVLGGLIFINSFPYLCRDIYLYFQEKRLTGGSLSSRVGYIIIYTIETIAGLLLMGNHRQIVNFIELKRRKATIPEPGSGEDQ
jgi:hypothetical protein